MKSKISPPPRKACLSVVILLASFSWNSAEAQIFVDVDTPAALSLQNGTSWALAYGSLDQGLSYAASQLATAEKEIWVADGVYSPSVKRDPLDSIGVSKSFSIPPNTRLYGGFRGTRSGFTPESSIQERVYDKYNPTVLDGLVQGTKVRHVVFCEPAVFLFGGGYQEHVVLDGFRIINGRASGPNDEDNRGGGVYAQDTSLIVKNCDFEYNQAANEGGAIYWRNDWDYNSAWTSCGSDFGIEMGFGVSESRFRSNIAINLGGAVSCYLAEKIPIPPTPTNHVPQSGIPSHVQNCEFSSNQAGLDVKSTAKRGGGAIAFFNCADLIVSGNVFANNSVHGKGSAVYMDHEWYSRACDGADPVLPHFSTFRNNTLFGNATLSPMSVGAVPPASLTGAIYSEPRPTNADPLHTAPIHEVSNSILYGNTHVTSIGLLDSDQFAPASDFAVHSSNVQYLSTIQVWPTSRPASAGYVGGENINQNPHFQDPLFGDFRLKDDTSSGGVRSPCIDTGTDFIKAGDAGDVNEDSDYELSNGGEIPFALNRTDDFFQNFGIGTARVLGTPLPGNPYPIDMGAMERE